MIYFSKPGDIQYGNYHPTTSRPKLYPNLCTSSLTESSLTETITYIGDTSNNNGNQRTLRNISRVGHVTESLDHLPPVEEDLFDSSKSTKSRMRRERAVRAATRGGSLEQLDTERLQELSHQLSEERLHQGSTDQLLQRSTDQLLQRSTDAIDFLDKLTNEDEARKFLRRKDKKLKKEEGRRSREREERRKEKDKRKSKGMTQNQVGPSTAQKTPNNGISELKVIN